MNRKLLLTVIGVALVSGALPLATYLTFTKSSKKTSEQVLDGANYYAKTVGLNGGILPDLTQASQMSINSVVHVTTKVVSTTFQRDLFQEFFYGPGAGGKEYKQFGSGAGSGVIISSEGYIVTNNHVIENASEIQVILNDNSEYTAKIIGADPSTDLAVLKIDGASNLVPMKFGNSDNLKIGEWVLAVGNPFNLTSTVTAGIVSAKARNINLLSERNDKNVVPIESFIQTDAAVNPGNSGGALVNTVGELVGINTAIASQTGAYSGYSFAIPVDLVEKVVKDLIDYGLVQRAYLGVQISAITQDLKEKENLPNLRGVYINSVVDGGTADKSGFKTGDVILKVGVKEVNSPAQLQEEIGKQRPGDKVVITVRKRNGDEVTLDVVLRNKDGNTDLLSKTEIAKNFALGATFVELTAKEKKDLNISYGVKIKTLSAGKLKTLGMTEGTVITKVNNDPVESVDEISEKLNGVNKGILLEIVTPSGSREYKGFGL
ncbi:MAG: trypsin-like peptidase domain-containing protein [Bacteroidetes bacterium]|nr:trypsin-like peptidase domain-containing protein [Bacteroidota bacterium]MBM3424459.1 PDZ domain-containing protein [Bacteroidota bacterium]